MGYRGSMKWKLIVGISIGVFLLTGAVFAFGVRLNDTAPMAESTIARLVLPEVQPVTTPAPLPRIESVTLLAVGDIMLDRTVLTKTQSAKTFDHPFLLFDPVFKEYDLRLANLEGPITTFPSVAQTQRFTFTFSPEFVEPLKKRFDVLSLANNHTDNFGTKGLQQARKFLIDAEIAYFGDPYNTKGLISTVVEKNGFKIAFVGYHELIGYGLPNVIEEVKKLKGTVDVIIVMPHWGVEYDMKKPSTAQKNAAHELIDAGADIIIGAHPHVIQPIEMYKDKLIFYSLGNFIFDQYFSVETMQGLGVGLTMKKVDGVLQPFTLELLPLTISTESQPVLASEEVSAKILEALAKVSIVAEEKKEEILEGNIKL